MYLTFRALLAAYLLAASFTAWSADRVVASIPGGASVTEDDVMADVHRLPPPAQAQLLGRPPELARFSQNLLTRRELARRAEAQGLLNDPKVAAALRAAQERVLSEAALDRAAGEPPDRATLERLARNQYDADPKKFDTPEQVRVRHVLISAKACEAEAKAREILAKASQPGADFAALAKANSDDPGSASRGGDLGFVARGRMVPAFEAAAFALKQPGDLSDVVKTDFGFHVIRLEERKPAERKPFEAVRDDLVKSIAQSEERSRRQVLLDQIGGSIQFNREAIDAMVAGGAPKPN
ncbi:MAG: peptidylprolyl isomerase [Burkholderiales bacterium]|nr:peptidylprolyl isomerase [Burkholderiales bacterium]